MTSLISAVPDGAAFVVTVRVCMRLRTCLSVYVFQVFFCVFVDTRLCVCNASFTCAVYVYLMQYKPLLLVFSLV